MKDALSRVVVAIIIPILLAKNGYTVKDVNTLADIMNLENGSTGKNEDENRQVLICTGAVVLNRVKSGEWGGHTINDVLWAKGQYASSTKNRVGKVDTPQYIKDIALELLVFGHNIPPYVIFQSMQPRLGTQWKVIAGEYFATNGGHKHEGDDWIAETNGNISDLRGSVYDILGNYLAIGHFGAALGDAWGNCFDRCRTALDETY